MDLPGGNYLVVKGEVPGCARIVQNRALKTMVEGGTSGGVDTHVGHHASDGHMIDIIPFQVFQKGSIPEGVWVVLFDNQFTGDGFDLDVGFHSLGSGDEK